MNVGKRATSRAIWTVLLLGLAALAPAAAQQTTATRSTGSRSQVELGTYGTFTNFGGGALGLNSHFGAGGRVAYFLTNMFALEASGDFTETDAVATGNRVTVTRLGGTFIAQKRFIGSNALYLGAGYERLFYRASETADDNGFHLALGNRMPIGGRAVFRVEGRAAYLPSSTRIATGDKTINLGASAGLSIFGFGGPPRDEDRDGVRDSSDDCAATPFGAHVDDAGCPTDEDSDSVFDGFDQCAGTPMGATVDGRGCPSDTDADQVFNGLDACPNTPAGALVDSSGCPSDLDADGIFDGLDQCPDTPPGALTDGQGCPLDGDGDTVFDGLDRCPATPVGVTVDATGCPSDSDMDGVLNEVDECPNTPQGAQVDARGCVPADSDRDGVDDLTDRCPNTAPGQSVDNVGCPVLFVVAEETGEVQPLVLRGVNFATGSSRLTDDSFEVLNTVAVSLLAHPEVRIEIGGHTDATGSLATNQRLSQARAESVLQYLARRGVDPSRMTAVGYGPDQPIATNTTAEGRAQNRRVELKQIN